MRLVILVDMTDPNNPECVQGPSRIISDIDNPSGPIIWEQLRKDTLGYANWQRSTVGVASSSFCVIFDRLISAKVVVKTDADGREYRQVDLGKIIVPIRTD